MSGKKTTELIEITEIPDANSVIEVASKDGVSYISKKIKLSNLFSFFGSSGLPVTALGTSGTQTINRTTSDKWTLTPASAVTLATSNFTDMQEATIQITSGFGLISFPSGWTWKTSIPELQFYGVNFIKIRKTTVDSVEQFLAWDDGSFSTIIWSSNQSILGPLDTYLKSAWKLSDVNDSKGTNTLNNNGLVTFDIGKNGNAATLSANKYLQNSTATSTFIDLDFTFNCWVYPTSYNSVNVCLLARSSSDYFMLYYTDSKITMAGSFLATIENTSATLSLNTWNMISFTRIGNVFKIYSNAIEKASSTQAITFPNITDITLGGNADADQSIRGKLDEVYIWSGHGMSPTEITALYNSATGSFYK